MKIHWIKSFIRLRFLKKYILIYIRFITFVFRFLFFGELDKQNEQNCFRFINKTLISYRLHRFVQVKLQQQQQQFFFIKCGRILNITYYFTHFLLNELLSKLLCMYLRAITRHTEGTTSQDNKWTYSFPTSAHMGIIIVYLDMFITFEY